MNRSGNYHLREMVMHVLSHADFSFYCSSVCIRVGESVIGHETIKGTKKGEKKCRGRRVMEHVTYKQKGCHRSGRTKEQGHRVT